MVTVMAERLAVNCPTPTKMRYPTKSAAQGAAEYRSRSVGIPLYAYKCACGSFHMTRLRQTVVEVPPATLLGVGHALGMLESEFLNVVINDVMNELDPDDGAVLRSPDVVDRWREGLIAVRQRAESELAQIRKLRQPSAEDNEWRTLLVEFVDAVGHRQRECAELRVKQQRITPYLRQTPSTERKVLRRTAGERAIEVLVSRHHEEFAELFREEAERIGFDFVPVLPVLPGGEVDMTATRELNPDGVDVTRPRFADVHLMLTGDESPDTVIALLIGAVYRHVRDEDGGPEKAARVMRDIAIQFARMEAKSDCDALNIASQWVTLHVTAPESAAE